MTHPEQDNDPLYFTVEVTANVNEELLEEEDFDVPGQYCIALPPEARGWSTSRQAKEVLDGFHNSIAIGCLDDFTITVLNDQEEEIFEEYEDED